MLSDLLWASLNLLLIGSFVAIFSNGYAKTSFIILFVSTVNSVSEPYIKELSNAANLTAFEVVALTDLLTAYAITKFGDFGKLVIPFLLALFVLTHSAYLLSYQLNLFDNYNWYSIVLIGLNTAQLFCLRRGIANAIGKLDSRISANFSSYRYNYINLHEKKN